MKKHLIAVAVAAAVAAPAMAQNVTISGTLDAAAHSANKNSVYNSATDVLTTTKALGSSSATAGDGFTTSQLVFTATEDLGGGLKATALFSGRLDQAAAAGSVLSTRDRYIEVGGAFGALRVGRFAGTIDLHNSFSGAGTTGTPGALNTYSTGAAGRFFGGATGVLAAAGGSFERNNNIVQFSTPSMNGLTGAFGFTNDNSDSDQAVGEIKSKMSYASLNYSAGPLTLMAATGQRKVGAEVAVANTVLANPGDTTKGDFNWVGGRYDLGAAVINATYATRKDTYTAVGAAAATTGDSSVAAFGIAIPVGALTIRASMYQGSDDRASNTNLDNTDLDGNQVSVTYALSKRTFVYVATGRNEVKLTQTLANTTAAGNKVSGTNLGISHTF
jgi:general bacterial porin, GBP family